MYDQHPLNITGNAPFLGECFRELAQYVKGTREDIGSKSIVATTPPSTKSIFLRPNAQDPFIAKCSVQQGNITLIRVGTYQSKDVGHTCYHGKLNALELFYHHLLDTEQDMVISDATAGIDNVGTSLYFASDVNIFVVEPTLKSVNVFNEFYAFAKEKSLCCFVVANKIRNEQDMAFLHKYIDPSLIIASFPESQQIASFEQGESVAFQKFVEESEELLQAIRTKTFQQKKNWKEYYNKLIITHRQNSEEWWNDYYHAKISEQFDPEFSYEKVIEGSTK